MDTNAWLVLAVVALGVVALVGFFFTKKKGYGRFATSSFLLLLVIIFTAMMVVSNKMPVELAANILFAVIGFAGGLFTGKEADTQQGAPGDGPRPAGSARP